MKQQFVLFRRGEVFYCEDTKTGKQQSLRTRVESEAQTLVHARNEACRQPAMNLQIAQVYLQHGDKALASRTWQQVMETVVSTKVGPTLERWKYAIRDRAFDVIRHRKLIETTPEHFLAVLNQGSISTNVFLRRAHNYAIGMHWLPWPVLPAAHWPAVKYRAKRAITLAEHRKIIERELNPEMNAYLRLLWHLGGSQSDMATLTVDHVDWAARTVAFDRQKTGVPVIVSFGEEVAAILRTRPRAGYLFPRLARLHEKHRAKLFAKRLATVDISGVSLHSYRYSWAERAKKCGMPERFAQQALGHSSKAFARAYSRKAVVIVPPLEEYEKKVIRMPTTKIAQNELKPTAKIASV